VALRRVLGAPALFSTAYGDVGSSIYYALGVTAMFALGLTPLAFVIAGLLFGALALTYAEGTAAMPEAGGASSFARRSFNDLVSFIAGWALALNYVVTMAISAFANLGLRHSPLPGGIRPIPRRLACQQHRCRRHSGWAGNDQYIGHP